MQPDLVREWGVIIVPIVLALIGLLNVYISSKTHKLVNGEMAQQKAENALLRNLLTAKQLEIDTAERARRELVAAQSLVKTVEAVAQAPVIAATTVPTVDPVKIITP